MQQLHHDLEADVFERLRDDLLHVPPYPAVVARLQSVLADERLGMREITSVVYADATLSATLLRLANSAAHGGKVRVDSLESAVLKLGTHELVKLATASSLGAIACAGGPLVWLRREQWRSSLFGAILCEALAVRRNIRPELAFMAGLLHGFGAVVVVACIEDISTKRPFAPLTESDWRKVVALYQVEFGRVVATKWRLPDAIAMVMARHHLPEACPPIHRPLVQLVVAVDQGVKALDDHPGEGINALERVRGLATEDRSLIASLLPRLAAKMNSFDISSGEPATQAASLTIAPAPASAADSWPVDFAAAVPHAAGAFRATAMSPERLELRGQASLTPGLLTCVTLAYRPEAPVSLLMNVKACATVVGGEHIVTLKPFGLGRAEKVAWTQLVTESRGAASVATAGEVPGNPE
jgi:HD-like signal output (HDOD) protein